MWDCRGLGKLNSQSFQMSLNMQEIYFKLKAVMKWLFTITVRHIEMSGVLILSKRCGKSWKQLWGFLFFFFFTANSDQVLHNGYIQTAISLLPVMFSLCATHLWNVWTTANFFQIKVVILNEKKNEIVSIMWFSKAVHSHLIAELKHHTFKFHLNFPQHL